MAFWKVVNTDNRNEMIKYLSEHFRYDTMNHWNNSTSYAHNMKIHNLDVSQPIKDKLYELLDCQDVYDRIQTLLDQFAEAHDFQWQAAFNGRSAGYLVLYHGDCERSEHKSFCRFCGQKNFTSVKETGNVCGKCQRPGKIDYGTPPLQVIRYPGMSVDMWENFEEDWKTEELRDRVKLVQEFDTLADSIVFLVTHIAENYSIREEIYYEPKTRKVLQQIEKE